MATLNGNYTVWESVVNGIRIWEFKGGNEFSPPTMHSWEAAMNHALMLKRIYHATVTWRTP